jgi:hypothetical protein
MLFHKVDVIIAVHVNDSAIESGGLVTKEIHRMIAKVDNKRNTRQLVQ